MRIIARHLSKALVLSAVACGSSSPSAPPPAPPPPAPAPTGPNVTETSLATVGLSADALDRKADPCQDFYRFACGGWVDKTEIPGDKPRWVRSFNVIHQRNEQELKRILEQAAAAVKARPGKPKASGKAAKQAKAESKSEAKPASPTPAEAASPLDPVTAKIGAYYASCMDEDAIEKRGLEPVEKLLKKARRVYSTKALTQLVTELHQRRIWALFDISAEQDFKDATRYIAYLDQNGLGLPDRDYYTKDDEKSQKIREDYQAHVARMLKLAGKSEAQAKAAAKQVMDVETRLAEISKTRVERRDPKGLYNKIDRKGLVEKVERFPWKSYFEELEHADIEDINVTSVKFFEGVNTLLKEVKLPAWRSYLEWQILHATAPALSKLFVDEAFSMKQVLTGQKEQRPRWKRCIESTDMALGELLAQPFIRERFAGESKQAAEKMVHAIGEAFVQEVGKLDWMDAETQQRARDKYAAMAYLIGYPARWREYDFEVAPDDYVSNLMAAREFELKRQLNKIGKPVDREEWEMTPPTVNAYYHPLKNQMVFPAGILQPPFYSVEASIPVNLGAMGMVVGHELTHGFDDQGAQFDAHGNLKDWWTKTSEKRFKSKTGCVADQYAAYEALPGLKLNGKLTLGENIADMGGVKLAFYAYRALRANADTVTMADGFDEDQQFFLAMGQVWCSKYREEYARMAAQVDPHSPPRFRVNGALANLPEFAEAFSCAEGTPMHPKQACTVW